MKKIVSLLILILMFISIMPAVGLAVSIPIRIGSLEYSDGYWKYSVSDGYWEYGPSPTATTTDSTLYVDETGHGTNTDSGHGSITVVTKSDGEVVITLNNASLTDGIKLGVATATIIINGTNSIVGGYNSSGNRYCGIDSENTSVNIVGNSQNDSLTIIAADDTSGSMGIHSKNLYIGSNTTLNVQSGEATNSQSSYAIFANNLTIDGIVHATASNATVGASSALNCSGNCTINNGAILTTCSGKAGKSYGVFAKGDILVNGTPTINIVASNSYSSSGAGTYGLFSVNGNINIEDGDIDIETSGKVYSYGLYAEKRDINIEDGDIDIEASGASSVGLYSREGNINIEDGDIDIEVVGTSLASGLLTEKSGSSLTIENAVIDILSTSTSGLAYGVSSYGIITIEKTNMTIHDKTDGIVALGSITIGTDSDIKIYDEGVVNAPTKCLPLNCAIHAGYGSFYQSNVTINNSKVLASSTNAYGIYASNQVNIDKDSTVKIIGGKGAINASSTNLEGSYVASVDVSGSSLSAFDLASVTSYKYITNGVAENKDNNPVSSPAGSSLVIAPESKPIPTVYIGEEKSEIKVEVDVDKYINGDNAFSANAPIFIENGRTYLGIRDMAYVLGIAPEAIKWNDENKTATISKSGAEISITQGSKDITLTYGGYIYTIHNDVSAVNRNDRIYLPFRVIFELFGYEVNWDNETRTITCK